MAEQKRRWGDRRDATLLRDTDALHFIMGIIYPNRADNEAYIAERVNLEPIKAYIAEKNYEEYRRQRQMCIRDRSTLSTRFST